MRKRTPKVLIVDDDPRSVRLLEAIVAPMGLETHVGGTGKEALEMAIEVDPDVILLDIRMPGMDGLEACRRLKEERATRNIPVVFVTAYADVNNHATAMEAGGIGFITKPVEDILVEASVKNAIRVRALSTEVEELVRQRNSLTQMMVHDINNLLVGILGYAQMLLSDDILPPTVRKDMACIETSARNIRIMTSSMLDLEKLESGTMEASPQKVDVWGMAKQRAQLLMPQVTKQRIHLELHEPIEDPLVRADLNLLSRVLDNLIFNAVKFCPSHGTIQLGASAGDATWTIAVTNDGPPIPPEYHGRIFQKFAQVEAREATGLKGIGLGLTFCKMAVEAMDGTIGVESPVDGREDGARFTFSLPAASGP